MASKMESKGLHWQGFPKNKSKAQSLFIDVYDATPSMRIVSRCIESKTGLIPSRCEAGQSGTSTEKAETSLSIERGYRDVMLITSEINANLQIIGQNCVDTSLQVCILMNKNNYQPNKDLLIAIQDLKKSVWLCITKDSAKDQAYMREIISIYRKRKELLSKSQELESVFSARLLILDTIQIRQAHPSLKNAHQLIFDGINRNNVKGIIYQLIKIHQDRKFRLHDITKELNKEPFVYLDIKLTNSNTKQERPTKEFEDPSKNLIEVLSDNASNIRQYCQKQLRSPHLKVVYQELSKGLITIQLRPYDTKGLQTINASLQNVTFAGMIKNYITVSKKPFDGNVQVSLSGDRTSTRLDEVAEIIQRQDVHQQGRRLHSMLQTDGSPVSGPAMPLTTEEQDRKKQSIFIKIAESFMKDKTRTPFDFLKTMKDQNVSVDLLLTLRNHNDYSIMHMAVVHAREDFLKMIFYLGLWPMFRSVVANPPENSAVPPAHSGYTARRVAESISFKEDGYKMIHIIDKYDDEWEKMNMTVRASATGETQLFKGIVDTDFVRQEEMELCLLYACGQGNRELVHYLLNKDVTPEKTTIEGESCATVAAMLGHFDVLEELSKYTFKIKGNDQKAITYCASTGNIDGLKFYKSKFEKRIFNPNVLTEAAKNRHFKMLKYVLEVEKGIDVNGGLDENGRNALHHSILNADMQSIKLLLEHKASLSMIDHLGNTVLHLAVESSKLEIVKFVISKLKEILLKDEMINAKNFFIGEDLLYVVRGRDKGRKAWHWIELNRLLVHMFHQNLKLGQIDVAKYGSLLKSGFGGNLDESTEELMKRKNADRRRDKDADMTPLHLALYRNFADVAHFLIENGADINVADYFGARPVHFACMHGNIDTLHLIEQMGVDLDVTTKDKITPLKAAESNDQVVAVHFLEARMVFITAKKFSSTLTSTSIEMDEPSLDAKRGAGRDIRRHMIDMLRGLNIEINETLQELGSGPVTETTSN